MMGLSGGAPSYLHIPLGTYYNNKYYTFDECSTHLEDLVTQLQSDDPKNHSHRLGLGSFDIINKDLKPMLISCYKDAPPIFRSAVKLLVGITTPIRCLTFVDAASNQGIHSSDVIYKLTQLLHNAKEDFLDPRSTRAIITHVNLLLENQPLTLEEIQSVNFCLLLIRNVLHIPERPSLRYQMPSSSQSHSVTYTPDNSQQNQMVCNLFAQGLSELLLNLLDCPQRDECVGTITQVISVLFKGRSAESIRNRLGAMFDAVPSESSSSSDDALSDINIFRKMTLSSPNSSISSKRMKDVIKSPELKKKRLVDECELTEEVTELLKIFVMDFMQNGYNTLVCNLHQQLSRNDLPMDAAQFSWLIAYFLGFAPLLKLHMEKIKDVMDIEILTYLTWAVVNGTEILEKNSFRSLNVDSHVRRLHRGVTAIREYLQVLEMYSIVGQPGYQTESDESQGFEEWTHQLRSYLPAMHDLHHVFILLLRQYNPNFQNGQYLLDVITTNHLLLVSLKRAAEFPTYSGIRFDLKEHLKQFFTYGIVAKYGAALKDFRTNGTYVNDCIFTFFLHLNGDLDKRDLLLEPVILCPIGEILKENFYICQDWYDLIQSVIQRYKCNQKNRDHRRAGETSGLPNPVDSFLKVSKIIAKANIEILINELRNSGFKGQLEWIQSSLLTTCSAQLGTYDGRNFCNPIACLSLRKNISCPIVPWTEVEASALHSNHFFCLLYKLNLLPVSRHDGFYPCIPNYWSPNILFRVASIFGPIDQQMVDFDLSLITNTTGQSHPYSPLMQYTNWEDASFQQQSGR